MLKRLPLEGKLSPQGTDEVTTMILLTGGTGYIGSHTAVEFINAGYDVVLADDLSNSERRVVDRIEQITEKTPAFEEIDVCDKAALDRVFETYEIDSVIHFAGYKAVGESIAEPVKYYRNNLDSTLTLLEVMKAHGCKRLIFSSSATVYGESQEVPFTEDSPAGGCTNPYGRTKYFIEQILSDACKADPGLSVALLRYFNPIGAHESGLIGEKPNGIPNNLMPYITQTAAGIRHHLSVFGDDYDTPDGTGVRDYIHVVDLAKGHLAACKYLAGECAGADSRSAEGCHVFNLGTGKGSSVLEIVHAFEKATGIAIPYEIAPRRPGDIAVSYADASKAEKVLGWKAQLGLQEMCASSWNWQQNGAK